MKHLKIRKILESQKGTRDRRGAENVFEEIKSKISQCDENINLQI